MVLTARKNDHTHARGGIIMYRNNCIFEKVTVFVTRILFCLLILSSCLVDLHNAAAKETDGEIKGGDSAAVQEEGFTLDSPEGALSLKDLRGKDRKSVV